MEPYVRNSWYMAAWADEVPEGGFLARRLLDRPWLIWRTAAGVPVMMADRCPHRFVPLSRGSRVGDEIRCGYHGLGFDANGRCVHTPFGGAPPVAQLSTFPVVERYNAFWFWPGDAKRADPSEIPDFGFLDDPDPMHRGHLLMDANYELIADNLLDLSHAEFLHVDSFGINGALHAHGRQTVERDESGAIWNRWDISGAEPPAWAAALVPEDGKVDQWLHMRWHAPSALALFIGLAHAGTEHRELVVPEMGNPHILTPETQDSTHYFYTHEPTEEAAEMTWKVFMEEDEPMVRAQQAAMEGSDFWALKPVILPSDAAAIRARRRLMQLRREEAPEHVDQPN